MRSWQLPVLVAVVVLALVASTATAAAQWQRARAADQRVDELRDEIEELRGEVERLERELAAARPATPDDSTDDPFGGLFDDLFGGDLGALFGGEEGIPGLACMVPDGSGGLDDLFGGLFGGGPTLPDDPDEVVDVIADHVAEMRELEWQQEVQVDFLDEGALRARIDELLAEDADPEADEIDQRLLEALGAIPPGTDLPELQRELLGDAVAGFYVPETGELVVRVPEDGRIRPVDRVTLAHELEHALADQVLGLPDLDAIDDSDAQLAALSVVEGDATLLMNLWALEHLSLSDQMSMAFTPDIAAAQAALDAAPHFVQRQLLFPYTVGLDYVCDLFLDGGWRAVDAAYADPPATSAEVVFRARSGQPPAPVPPLTTPVGYDEARADTFGLAPLQWLFEAPGGEPDRALSSPRERAAAWAGGEVVVWTRGPDTAIGAGFVDGGGGPSLCDSVTDWYDAAFPDRDRRSIEGATSFESPGTAAVVACAGTDVRLAIAPDLPTATAIVSR